MKIGIVSQFYAPEPGPAMLPTELANELARRGHEVQVVTGFPNYPTGQLADGYKLTRRVDEMRDGVAIRRVYLHPDHASAAGRLCNYTSFGISSLANGLGVLRHVDAVWVNASPITLSWPILGLRAIRRPVVSHILDLWPESLYATGFGRFADNRVARKVLEQWTGSIYRNSDLVAHISPGVRETLIDRGVPADKLRHVPMWADERTFHPGGTPIRQELGLTNDAIVMAYAGALGDAQGLETLIDACSQVRDPRFVCLIAGSGSAEAALRGRARNVNNVRFLGRLPQARMTDLMASIDASYISLRDTALGSVSTPSKTQAALASGVPILAAAKGDLPRIVEASRVGLTADPTDPTSVALAINHLCRMSPRARAEMGRAARATYVEKFSLSRGADRVEEMLHEAASNHRKQVQSVE